MYWWNLDRLRAELANDQFDEGSRFAYLLACALMTSLAIQLPGGDPAPDGSSYLIAFVHLLTIAGGTWWAYRQNGGADGRQFLERYLSLSWVITLRFFALVVVLGIAYVASTALWDPPADAGYWPAVTGWLFELAIYQRLGHHIRKVAQAGTTAAAS